MSTATDAELIAGNIARRAESESAWRSQECAFWVGRHRRAPNGTWYADLASVPFVLAGRHLLAHDEPPVVCNAKQRARAAARVRSLEAVQVRKLGRKRLAAGAVDEIHYGVGNANLAAGEPRRGQTNDGDEHTDEQQVDTERQGTTPETRPGMVRGIRRPCIFTHRVGPAARSYCCDLPIEQRTKFNLGDQPHYRRCARPGNPAVALHLRRH